MHIHVYTHTPREREREIYIYFFFLFIYVCFCLYLFPGLGGVHEEPFCGASTVAFSVSLLASADRGSSLENRTHGKKLNDKSLFHHGEEFCN